jgi:hypothetical protein
MSLIPTICSCTCKHRSKTNGRRIRTIVNDLQLVADMELQGQMSTTIGLEDPLAVTARAATTVNDHLVDDRMTIIAAETTDDGHHREEIHMDHRRPRDENHTATIPTTEARPHHPEAMAPIPMPEVVTRTVPGQGLRHDQAMEASMQMVIIEDTIEFPASIHDSALMPSTESQLLELIHIDRVLRGNIIAQRTRRIVDRSGAGLQPPSGREHGRNFPQNGELLYQVGG